MVKRLFLKSALVLLALGLVALTAACNAGATVQSVPSSTTQNATSAVSPTASPTPTPTQSPQNRQPIEVISLFEPKQTPNPGGPVEEITLKNVATEPVISLAVILESEDRFYEFPFYVAPSNALLPGKSISSTLTIIGGGLGFGLSYPVTINATLQNGSNFVYTKQVQFEAP